ncbi:uncharacterized protein N7518_004483 [Penicillium psychrosexuale]|uniref:uncharacterized protein n=1 Tax=Penicillium psychrosexuale TaxID=1002107 RepID=UPI0025451845|nr:uncharacterized protein N7518_004483 [Penicillium psychrosexuale]KAJ5795943.1 hypothetical protein N7518_004483 [Penicillium psychrosexuale]
MCFQTYNMWTMCNCIHFGRVERCKEFGVPFLMRERCTGVVLRALNIGILGIPEERLFQKAGMCPDCSEKLYQEMWALRWKWTSRQSEEWAAKQKSENK